MQNGGCLIPPRELHVAPAYNTYQAPLSQERGVFPDRAAGQRGAEALSGSSGV